MWEDAATFLLEIPPIDEIGGKLNYIVEQYRSNTITKEMALQTILKNHKRFLENYVEINEMLNR